MSYTGWLLTGICFASLGTLFFSIHTTAYRAFSRIKLIESLKRFRKEKYADPIVEQAEKLMLTCSVFRLAFNMFILLLILAIFAGHENQPLNAKHYVVTSIVALGIYLVFSLALPYAIAKYAGEKIISRTFKLVTFLSILVSPVLYVLKLYDEIVRRLTGSSQTTIEEQQEEFLTELEQQKMEGIVDEEEQEMIENVLELTDTAVNEIMTPRTDIIAVEVTSDLESIIKCIKDNGPSRLPVYEDNIDNIIGLIYAKDLLDEFGKKPADFDLRSKMRDVYFVPETKPLRALLHEFQNQKLHMAIVLDEYGGTAGIVTIEDILEQLVGEIADEYELPEPEQIRKIDENTIEVDARTYIDDLNDQFELSLPEEEDYDTIGGFVFSHLGYIPKTGETFEYGDLIFNICSAESRKIERIKITKKAGEKNAD